MTVTQPTTYKAICYWITGQEGNYTGCVVLNDRVLLIQGGETIVKTNQLIRQRIDLCR